jgi:hypothetical protein
MSGIMRGLDRKAREGAGMGAGVEAEVSGAVGTAVVLAAKSAGNGSLAAEESFAIAGAQNSIAPNSNAASRMAAGGDVVFMRAPLKPGAVNELEVAKRGAFGTENQ